MKQEQKELFEDWNIICNNLKSLSGYIQNDFNKLINDESFTEEELINSFKEFDILYETFSRKLKMKKEVISGLLGSLIINFKEK